MSILQRNRLAIVFFIVLNIFSTSAPAADITEKVWYVANWVGAPNFRVEDPEQDCLVNVQSRYSSVDLIYLEEYKWGAPAHCYYLRYYFGWTAQLVKQYDYAYETLSCPAGTFLDDGECREAPEPRPNLGGSCCDNQEGNPVNTATGNKFQVEMDYAGTANGTLRFQRFYNSAATYGLPGTNGWRNSYQRSISVLKPYSRSDAAGSSFSARAIVTRDDGQEIAFYSELEEDDDGNLVATGEWEGPAWSDWHLASSESGYQLHHHDGTTEVYDQAGRLLRIETLDGQLTELHRDDGRITSIVDSYGRSLEFDHSSDRLVTVTLPGGEEVHYDYDGQARLESVTYADGATRSYLYEKDGYGNHLTGIVDANGERYSRYAYDQFGRAVLTEHAGGANRVTIEYPPSASISSLSSGEVHSRQFTNFEGLTLSAGTERYCSGCVATEKAIIRDSAGRPVEIRDHDGTVTRMQRNARGFVTSRTEAVGTPEQRTGTTEWHPDFRLPTRITEPGRITAYTYDGSGNRLSQTVTDTVNGESRTTSWTYNDYGQVLTADGPRTDVNDVITYTYDAQGNVSTVTNALGQVMHYTDYDVHGNPLRIVDANGIVTELEYDLRQRLTSRTVATGTADAATTTFTYDLVGQLIETVLPNGASIHYDYDAAHRLVAIEDNLGNRIDYTLDAMGNRIEESVSGPGGSVFRETRREYNTLNRLVASIGGEGQRTTYDYDADGNRTGITDAAYNTTTNRYDALDRLFETVDALGGITQYHYDPSDNLVQVIDPRGVTTGYTYNGFNELTETVSPDAGTTTYAYDKAGNRTSQTDARGITVQYQYDALNRLVFIDYPEPADGSPSQDIIYVYDEGPNGIGRLSRIDDETGSTDYYYGARGNLLSKVTNVNGIELAVDYSVDTADNLTGVHYPSGASVSYSRDMAGRITTVTLTDPQGNQSVLADAIDYAPFGPITGMYYGNGISETRTFDRDGRLTRLSSSALDYSYTWNATNNITGITDNLDSTKSQSFGYDTLYRLTHATGSYGNLDWQYDAVGNRTRETDSGIDTAYGYEQTSNRLASVTGPDSSVNYDYDANGNTLNDGEHGYAYDARNRLVEADSAYTYQHNALGQRVSKPRFQTAIPGDASGDGVIDQNDLLVLRDILRGRTFETAGADCSGDGIVNNKDVSCIANQIGASKNNGKGKGRNRDAEASSTTLAITSADGPGTIIGETLFVYDEAGHLVGEYDESGEVIREYIWLGDRPVAMIDSNGSIHYIHSDHLNTPKVVTDENQTVAWKGDYSPFGEVEETVSTIEFNLRFPGQYYDAETGLNYNYFRTYNPATGRYTQSDPIGLSGGPNIYAYSLSNPLTFIDWLGLKCEFKGFETNRVFPHQWKRRTITFHMEFQAPGPGTPNAVDDCQPLPPLPGMAPSFPCGLAIEPWIYEFERISVKTFEKEIVDRDAIYICTDDCGNKEEIRQDASYSRNERLLWEEIEWNTNHRPLN